MRSKTFKEMFLTVPYYRKIQLARVAENKGYDSFFGILFLKNIKIPSKILPP